MADIIFDAETVGTPPLQFCQQHPDFRVLFNGWMMHDEIFQDHPANPQVYLPLINYKEKYPARFIGHNLKFDIKCMLRTLEPKLRYVKSELYDTQLAFHLIREDLNSYKLEHLAQHFYQYPNYKNLVDFDGNYWEDMQTLKIYNKHDLLCTKRLKDITEPILKKQGKWKLFQMLMDYVGVLSQVEMKGIKVDRFELEQQRQEYQLRESALLYELKQFSDIDWSGTTDEVRDYFGKRFKKLPKTKLKKAKIDENILKGLDCEEARLLLRLREVQKQLHTYIEGFDSVLIDGIYYPDYNLTNTVTGRLSERYIQLMPRKETSQFKKIITSKFEGGYLLECDWSRLEALLQAEMIWIKTGMHKLADDLVGGFDIHDETLKRFPFLPDRTRAKNANFSCIFGGRGKALVQQYGFTWEQAEAFVSDLTETRYPELAVLFRGVQSQVYQEGRVFHPYTNRTRHTGNYNEGLNAPIQGIGSDYNKIMTIRLQQVLKDCQSHLIADVHDALIVDVHPEEKEEVIGLTRAAYGQFHNYFHQYFGVDLKLKYNAEFKIGRNLYNMEKI